MFAPVQLAIARKETVPAGYLEGGTKDLGTHEFGHDGGADSQDRGSVDGETGEEEFSLGFGFLSSSCWLEKAVDQQNFRGSRAVGGDGGRAGEVKVSGGERPGCGEVTPSLPRVPANSTDVPAESSWREWTLDSGHC